MKVTNFNLASYSRCTGGVVRIITALVLLLMLATVAQRASGQATTGSIQRVLKDPTDAVVPNATVKALEIHSGIAQSTESNGRGAYFFGSLPPGSYDIAVSAHGWPGDSVGKLPSRASGVRI